MLKYRRRPDGLFGLNNFKPILLYTLFSITLSQTNLHLLSLLIC
jgi:hypothetical protein